MVRITFLNYGTVEHMFFEEHVSEQEAIKQFQGVWGVPVVPEIPDQPKSIQLVSVGIATSTKDTGGFGVGKQAA